MGNEENSTNIVKIIQKKRDKEELSHEDIQIFIDSTVNGTAQDCQIGAMLMAMLLNGLSDQESSSLTKCMIKSGEVLIWPNEWSSILVDKHSTGGIGDKISLVLAPALAACGAKVPMVSGRGLDITGGTLDKLESIPGYQVVMTKDAMLKALSEVGCFIAGQSANLVPADKELYQRRDVTSTVPSHGLIVGSILSKKAAEGAKSLILDLKVGKAAFYKSVDTARHLAEKIINISKSLGMQSRVAFTRMDTPIGYYVGNSLEVAESVYSLQGKAPEDIECLVEDLGGHLLEMSGLAKDISDGKEKIHTSLHDGSALEKFCKMIQCHGVDPEVAKKLCEDPWMVLPQVKSSQITTLTAKQSGTVHKLDAMSIGQCCRDLGAGRLTSSQPIDHRVGIVLLVKEGQRIEKGSPWIKVHHSTPTLSESLRAKLEEAISFGEDAYDKKSIIIDVLKK